MPLDINYHFNNLKNSTANKSWFGSIITSPVWASIIIVSVLLLVLYMLLDELEINAKLIFWMFISTLSVVTLHDILYDSQMKEKYESVKNIEIVNSVHGGSDETEDNVHIQPRMTADENINNVDDLIEYIE